MKFRRIELNRKNVNYDLDLVRYLLLIKKWKKKKKDTVTYKEMKNDREIVSCGSSLPLHRGN